MKQHLNPLRPATAALFAALVLPIAPVFAQDTLTATPPPVIVAPPPPVVAAPPPITATPAPPPVATPRPTPAPAPVARSTNRTTTTRTTTTRTAAPARTVTRAPAPAARAPAPTPAPAPAPVAQTPVETAPPPAPVEALPPPVAPEETVPPTGQAQSTAPRTMLPWIIGGGLLLLALIAGYFLFFRGRRREDVYEETYYEPAPPREEVAREPSFVAPIEVAPVAAAEPWIRPTADPVPEPRAAMQPVADEPIALPPPEEINVAEADHADIEALAASSEPVAGRPWLEFLMRPMRAGTNRDNAIVQFELTVGNTGDAPARDVRISTWVVAAGEGTDYERSLIDPPADTAVQQVAIDAGEGATVEAKIGVAKDLDDESILPVVVADARYTLPDGSEGRTHASFAVGVPAAESGELEPFLTDRSSGLRENVEARLHGEPERV